MSVYVFDSLKFLFSNTYNRFVITIDLTRCWELMCDKLTDIISSSIVAFNWKGSYLLTEVFDTGSSSIVGLPSAYSLGGTTTSFLFLSSI